MILTRKKIFIIPNEIDKENLSKPYDCKSWYHKVLAIYDDFSYFR